MIDERAHAILASLADAIEATPPTTDARPYAGMDPEHPAYVAAADQDLARLNLKLDQLADAWSDRLPELAEAMPDPMNQVAALAYLFGTKITTGDCACLLAIAIDRFAK
jgi:hypothetical protein